MQDIDTADNLFDDIDALPDVSETIEESTSPVEQTEQVDATKAFAKRLKEETIKIREEERANLAKTLGYETYDDMVKHQQDSKMLQDGYDPETLRPMLNDLLKTSPEYVEAMQYKKEKEELEKELFVKDSLKQLNESLGTTFTDIKDLDKDTIDLWNKGLPLDKAYAAANYTKLMKPTPQPKQPTGKEHMQPVEKGATKSDVRVATEDDIRRFRIFNPNATVDEINKFINNEN